MNPELNLIGLIIKKPDLLENCQRIRNFDNPFSLQAYNEIWTECMNLYSAKGEIDKRELIQAVKEKNISFEIVLQAIKEAGFVEDLPEYTGQVYRALVRRRLTSLAMNLSGCQSDEFEDVGKYLNAVRGELEYLESRSSIFTGVTLGDAVKAVTERAIKLTEGDQTDYLKTGIYSLDKVITGFATKTMSVIGARPSVGKSALGLTMLSNMSSMGNSVGFISVEMSEEECVERIIQMRSGVSMEKFRENNVSIGQLKNFMTIGENLAKSHLIQIVRTTDRKISNIRSLARRMKNNNPDLKIIFIDYLQKIQGDGKQQDKRTEVGQVSGIMTDMATDLDLHICCLAQINRSGDEMPRMKDLKESGDIEQDASYIIIIHRDINQQFGGEYNNDTDLIISKNRQGRTGIAKVKYNCQTTRFYDEATEVF